MAQMYINYGSFEGWANKIDADNKKLLEDLHTIKNTINGLSSTYQSNASTKIREKITGMETRFQNYYDVVDSYVRFVRATAAAYKNIEQVNTTQASKFI